MSQIKPSTSTDRKLLFLETVLNTAINDDGSSRVSKVSDHSVLSGIAGGIAKIAQKAEKDIALAVSKLFPDDAYGEQLDEVAQHFGVGVRKQALGSTTYVRLVGNPGTQYIANTHYFISNTGVRFQLQTNVTIPSIGYTYAKVASTTVGSNTNIEPLTLTRCSPEPTGHKYCINEYMGIGGRDVESDDIFRLRIKDANNLMARGTLAMIEQVFLKINSNILKVFNFGIDLDGKQVLAIATQNAALLTQSELDELLDKSKQFFNLNEYRIFGTEFVGIRLKNIEYTPIDVSLRVQLDDSYNPDDVRKDIQIQISKYLDHRFFDCYGDNVEWDRLLQICQNTPGVKYVPDQYFYPRIDLTIDVFTLPILRSFLMLNLQGQVIVNHNNTLSPVFYPNVIDYDFHSTMLANL